MKCFFHPRLHRARWPAPRLGQAGVAAVEFALLVPIIGVIAMALLDFGYAYLVKLEVVNATTAAAAYAYENGQSLASSGVAGFITNVTSVATGSEKFPVTPTVSVLYNNAASNANYGNTYCLSGSPPTWTASTASTCGPSAPNVTPGVFVSVSITLSFTPFFPTDQFFLGGVKLNDSAIVRVE